MAQQLGGERGGVRVAHEAWRTAPAPPAAPAARASAGRRPSAGGARPGAGSGRRRPARRAALRGTWPARASRRSAPSVVGLAQVGIAPAPDELQRLRQEFDLANAALAELHVVAGDARQRVARASASAPPLCSIDPPLHGVDVGDRGEVQAAAPDERPDRLQERRAQRQIAGHRARLDHRGALPVLAHAFVVGDGGGQRDGGRRHRRDRGAAAGRCGTRSRRRRAPPSARPGRAPSRVVKPPMRVALGGFRVYWRRRIVEQHEVDIGRNSSVRGRRACPCRAP